MVPYYRVIRIRYVQYDRPARPQLSPMHLLKSTPRKVLLCISQYSSKNSMRCSIDRLMRLESCAFIKPTPGRVAGSPGRQGLPRRRRQGARKDNAWATFAARSPSQSGLSHHSTTPPLALQLFALSSSSRLKLSTLAP